MKELNLYCPTGWMNGLYNISTNHKNFDKSHNKLNANNMFWNSLFDVDNIVKTVNAAKNRFSKKDNISDKILAAINNQQVFIELLLEAINTVTNNNLSEKEVFYCLETIQIFCDMYSLLNNSAFKLSIDSGYICENNSSKFLFQNCLSNNFNPYLSFVEEKLIPIIISQRPDIVWFEGKISIASFAIARIIREKLPKTHIIISKHSNEYYSLNKIIPLLKQNTYFFDVFDCVLLDETYKTKQRVLNAIQNEGISKVSNIIYKHNDLILINTFNSVCFETPSEYVDTLDIPSDSIINIKLFPNNNCYWKKCSFCGINKKYIFCQSNNVWNIDFAIEILKALDRKGLHRFWAIDEAIPINILIELAKRIINERLNFIWHVRTRIEIDLTDEKNIIILKESGLEHILLGLESASNRIVTIIKKTSIKNYTEIAERIISLFDKYKIKIHCPVIIGFPSETVNERNETFDFIERMKNKYSQFSYNINIFYLDIGSEMFQKWTDYNMTSVSIPCEPNYFIGNNIDWTSYDKQTNIDLFALVEKHMKNVFEWYPNDAIIPINTFYMLIENMKYPLISFYFDKKATPHTVNQFGKLNKYISVFKNKKDLYCLYNLKNHQNVICTKAIYDVITNNSLELIESNSSVFEKPINELMTFMTESDFFIEGGEKVDEVHNE